MKSTLAVLLLTLLVSNTSAQFFMEDDYDISYDMSDMPSIYDFELTWDDIQFGNQVFQNMWNGFLRGYYRSTKINMISD